MSLTLHLNARDTDRIFTTFQLSGVHTGTPSDGSQVQVWDDEADSTATDFVLFASGAGAPNWRATTPLMLLPCLDFDGIANNFQSGTQNTTGAKSISNFITASAATLIMSFYAESITTTAAAAYNNHCLIGDHGGYWGVFLRNVSGQRKAMFYNYDGSEDQFEININENTSYVLMFRHEGGNLYGSINGGTEFGPVASGNTQVLTAVLRLGVMSLSQSYNGRIGEVKIWNTGNADGNLATELASMISTWVSTATTVTLGQAVEGSVAQALTVPKIRLIGQALTGDRAQTVTAYKNVILGQALTGNLAQALTALKTVTVAQALTGDRAQTITAYKNVILGQAITGNLAQPVTAVKSGAVAQALTGDLAQTVTAYKNVILALAVEANTAQPVTLPGAITVTVAQAVSGDLAQTVTAYQHVILGQATEADTAQTVTAPAAAITVTVGQALEGEAAQTITAYKHVILGQAVEGSRAQAVLWTPKHRLITIATEGNRAQPLTTGAITVSLTLSLEADLALFVALNKAQIPDVIDDEIAAAFFATDRPSRPDALVNGVLIRDAVDLGKQIDRGIAGRPLRPPFAEGT